MNPTFYGNYIYGIWICPQCKKEWHPLELQRNLWTNPFKCGKCKINLVYKERET